MKRLFSLVALLMVSVAILQSRGRSLAAVNRSAKVLKLRLPKTATAKHQYDW